MSGAVVTGRLRALAMAAGADHLAAEVARLEERVGEQRFHVVCVGQFKRGKSTLVNALIGHPVLPTGVVPVTSVPTIVRHGPLGARVRFREGWQPVAIARLDEFVTERHNPANAKGVLAIEVRVPSPILEQGLCLVDTPGLGSVTEANSAATREFIPQIDAAVVILGADPPISGEELQLVEAIAAEVETLLFVINKVDRVTSAELEEASGFIRRVLLDRLKTPLDQLYHVSATGGGGGPDWVDLTQRLLSLAASDREAFVTVALQRGVKRLGGILAVWLRERRAALMRPVEESERRVDELRQLTEGTDRALRELNPLFGAEEQRLARVFEQRAGGFVADALPAGLTELRAAWAAGRFDRASRVEALDGANGIARELVYPWLSHSEQQAEAEFQETVRHFFTLGAEHLMRLGQGSWLDAPLLGRIMPSAEGFRLGRHFGFSDRLRYHHYSSPWPLLLDAVVPAATRRRRRQAAAERYLDDLLTVNASRVTGDLAERVRESRREVEAEIREVLRRVHGAALDALVWARAVWALGAEGVEREAARLEELREEVERLLEPMQERAA